MKKLFLFTCLLPLFQSFPTLEKLKNIILLVNVFFFLCLLPTAYCSALRESVLLADQLSVVDSLSLRLKKTIHDTDRVNTLNALGRELMYNNPDTAIILSNQALEILSSKYQVSSSKFQERKNLGLGAWDLKLGTLLATTLGNLGVYNYFKADYPRSLDYYLKALSIDEELNNKKGIATRLGSIGIVYKEQGDYPKALDYYFRALKMEEELGNKNNIAAALVNIGSVYMDQGDYPKALDYYFKALKINEELGNKNNIAANLGNIGIVYMDQGDYPKALDYYFKALKINEELGNKNGIAINLGNIGIVYKEQASAAKSRQGIVGSDSLYKKALDYYFRALKIAEELGNKNHIAAILGNIGSVYSKQGDYPKALDYYFRALKMAEELGDKNGIAINLGNIGSLYTKTGKFKEAEEHLLQAIAIDSAIGAQNNLMDAEGYLSHLYDTLGQINKKQGNWQLATGNWQLSLLHYKKAMVLKDTIFSEENKKQIIRKEMTYEFEKKEAAAKAESDKQAAVAAAESKRQSLVIKSLVIGALLVLAFAGFIYRALRITRKQKRVIEIQKAKVEEQKRIVEEKQNEILASIRYAKRIQDALLPRESYIDKTLKRLMKKN